MLATAANNAQLQPQVNLNKPSKDKIKESTAYTALEDLYSKLHDPMVNDSLSSFEGVTENIEDSKPVEAKTLSKLENMLQTTIPVAGYSIASALHTVAAINRTIKFLPKSLGDFIDKNVQYISKLVNTGVFASKSITAFSANQACDGLGRILNPLATWFVPQEDMYLASGFSSGSTMINFSQKHLNKESYKPQNNLQNLLDHLKAYKQKWSDIIKGGLSHTPITLDRKKNKGHLMFIGGNLNFLGAALGMTLGQGSHFMKAIGSVVRNTGSVVSDVAKMIDEDKNFIYAGILYGVVSIFDVWQAVINNKERSHTISHITQALNNFANYFYTKPSDNAANRMKTTTSNQNNKFMPFSGILQPALN